jgi:hypothetical protein
MAWTPIRTMTRGARPDFALLRAPENNFVTPAQRWFIDQLLDLEPGSEDVDAGGYSHKPGYHDTVAHNDARAGTGKDYSTRDPEDRRGPHNKGRARDWTFRDAQAGNFTDFAKYGDRLLAAYRRNDPRLGGWREYLGRVSTPVTVNSVSTRRVGIDFRHRYLRIPDDSHDWHGHFSEDTEQVESFWNKWALLTIMADWSLADWQQSIEEEFMAALSDKDQQALIWRVEGLASGRLAVAGGPTAGEPIVLTATLRALEQKVAALGTAVGAVDELTAAALDAKFAAIDADQEAVVAAVREAASASAERDAALLALLEQHADGSLDAEAVVRRMGEVLTGQAQA